MVALFVCSIILGCLETKTNTQKAREYLLHDPKRSVRFIQSLSQEEQVYIVTQLSEEFPQRIIPLCEIVHGETQKRCMRIAKRPHLWTVTNQTQIEQSATETCAHPHICREKEAINAIEQGRNAAALN